MSLLRLALPLAMLLVVTCGGSTKLDGTRDADATPEGGAPQDASSEPVQVCTPGATESCYSGLPATQGVGPCHSGTRTCSADGSGFGPCTGEVTPKSENCTTPEDEDCDGHTVCAEPIWSKSLGDGTGTGVAVDSAGDIVVVGGFSGSIDFGNGPLDAGSYWALFVAKFDGAGMPLWSKAFPVLISSSDWQHVVHVGVDDLHNIVVVSSLAGTVDFGEGPLGDIVVAKLDPTGKSLWSKGFGDMSGASALAVDPAGNIFLTGGLKGTLDFGGGPLGADGAFLVELGPDGSHAWSKGFPGPVIMPDSLAVQSNGNLLVTGIFGGLSKTSPTGELLWAVSLPDEIIAADAFATFDPGGDVLVAGRQNGYGSYEVKLNASGQVLWTKVSQMDQADIAQVATDKYGNLVIGGGGKDFYLPNYVAVGAFVAKLSATGDPVWCHGHGDENGAAVLALAVGPNDEIVTTGWYKNYDGSLPFDFGNGPLPYAGPYDNGFLAKIGP